ncbi:MAG: (Fe-S)-binding protein [Candidatus Marinimicrobia bacterium]|nr:(Fe-S)-binding protein [Candidatus Neomarinimicrobiota bacterium]
MKTEYLKDWENELNICIRCGYCFEGCPIFNELGWEIDGARGKLVVAYGLLTGEIEPSEHVAEKLFQCTFCKDCVERCSANVSVPDILSAARADLYEAGYSIEGHQQLLNKLEKSGNIFGKELKAPVYDEEKPVMLGCRLLENSEDANKYLELLKKLGLKPKTFDETCCGMPPAVLGDKKGFKEQQNKFRDTIEDKDKEVICLCTTCAFFIDKKYPDLKAKYVITEIAERLKNYKGKIKKLNTKLTYHDACNLARGMDIVDAPREVLKMIGVELVELPTNGKQAECCGGGGGLLVTDNPLAEKLSTKRMKQVSEIGVDTMTSLCPTCVFNLGNAAEKMDEELAVKNVLDLVYEAVC